MGLSAVVSTYQQYKQDTDSVAAWLASTAKSLGFSAANPSANLSATTKPESSARLKGKARAQAKAKAKAKDDATTTGPKYIIDIKDFVPLAKFIASKAAPVPNTFKTTIDRVICMRSKFSNALQEHGTSVDEHSDAKHQYFVQVLEKVRDVLAPFMLAPFMPAHGAKPDASKHEKVNNKYANLTVYEPSQEFLEAPDIERPTKVQNDDAVYEAGTEHSLAHAIFALSHAMNDMTFIRNLVKIAMWTCYKIDELDIVSAAITTNTAIGVVRNMIEDITPLLDRHGGVFRVLQLCHGIICFQDDWETPPVEFDYDIYDKGYGDYILLFELFERLNSRGRYMILYNKYKTYDPKSDWSSKTGRERFQEDQELLQPLLTELTGIIVAGYRRYWPVEDELLRGLEEMYRTKKVPFYLVFAARIFLDVTYTLGEDIERPFETLVSHTTMIENDIKSHVDFHSKLELNTWPAGKDEFVRNLEHDIRQVITRDVLGTVVEDGYRLAGKVMPAQKSHRLFRISPVISGLFLYNLRSRYHRIGLDVADNWGSIQCCKHLYNALLKENMLRGRWRDMDVVAHNLNPDSFYVGSTEPKTMLDCYTKFCLQMGTSAVALSKNRRKKTVLVSKAGPRLIKRVSPVLTMFEAQYVDSSGPAVLTREHITHIVGLSIIEKGSFSLEVLKALGINDPNRLREKLKQQAQRGGGKQAAKGDIIPFHQLLQPLILSLEAEVLEYAFPYLTMHRWCLRLLGYVREACILTLRECSCPTFLDKSAQNAWVVAWILRTASGAQSGVSDRRPLQLAAQMMNRFFDSGASRFVEAYVLIEKIRIIVKFNVRDPASDDGESRNVLLRVHPILK